MKTPSNWTCLAAKAIASVLSPLTATCHWAAEIARTLGSALGAAASVFPALVPESLPGRKTITVANSNTLHLTTVVTLTTAFLGLISVLPGRAQPAPVDVGEISPRPEAAPVTNALSLLQAVQAEIPKRCANLAAQADPLSAAINAYRADPSAQNGLRLLRQEAVIAGVGSADCEKIGAAASRAAGVCKDMAAQCAHDAAALFPDLQQSQARAVELGTAKANGIEGLRRLHLELRRRGVTNEAQLLLQLSRQERARIETLLRLTGAADLSERFARMDATVTDLVRTELVNMAKAFEDKEASFRQLADSYQTHADSFRAVAASVAHVSAMVEMGQRYGRELGTAREIEVTLRDTDGALRDTFEGLPADIDFRSSLVHPSPASKPAETGFFKRLLRFLGLGQENKPNQVTSN